MTIKQFRRKVEIARLYGEAYLGDGCTLIYHGPGGSGNWAVRNKDGNTVDVADVPCKLEYLFD